MTDNKLQKNNLSDCRADGHWTKIVNKITVPEDYDPAPDEVRLPVEPLTFEEVQQLQNYFYDREETSPYRYTNIRNFLYVVLAANTSRRCGDLLNLQIGDVIKVDPQTGEAAVRQNLIIRKEEKTEIRSVTPLNASCQIAILEYLNTIPPFSVTDWLFPNYKNPSKHITVSDMRQILQRTCRILGINKHIGTHSLRKALPYHAAQNMATEEDELRISDYLGHRDLRSTRHYTGQTLADKQELSDKYCIPVLEDIIPNF